MAIVQFYIADRKDEDPSEITNNLRYELPDDHNFSADDDLDSCIEECAGYYHHDCDGWENRFPCLFMLWIDDEYLGIFEVEREFEPVFSAKRGAMKDRIKFNDAMLAAVMDGRKTQTRRPIEPQPKVTEDELRKLGAWQEGYTLSEQVCAAWRHGFIDVDCPYGEIGDIISVADKGGNIKGKIEITDVWLQQVNDISESDAKAEGFDGYENAYSSEFALVWDAIYGTDSWMNNDWVWVIEFKKVE